MRKGKGRGKAPPTLGDKLNAAFLRVNCEIDALCAEAKAKGRRDAWHAINDIEKEVCIALNHSSVASDGHCYECGAYRYTGGEYMRRRNEQAAY